MYFKLWFRATEFRAHLTGPLLQSSTVWMAFVFVIILYIDLFDAICHVMNAMMQLTANLLFCCFSIRFLIKKKNNVVQVIIHSKCFWYVIIFLWIYCYIFIFEWNVDSIFENNKNITLILYNVSNYGSRLYSFSSYAPPRLQYNKWCCKNSFPTQRGV